MKLELTLLELNQLYYATSKLVEQNESYLKELGKNISSIEYFRNELKKSEVLRDKIQTALYDECKSLDEALDYVSKFNAEQYDRERDILKNAIDEEVEPEYDGAGFTEDDRIVNGQYRVVSNEDADEDAKQRDYSAFNNYADTIKQDEQRYNNKKLFTLNQNR
jgi:GTPase SAR1 family protein